MNFVGQLYKLSVENSHKMLMHAAAADDDYYYNNNN